MNGDFVPLAEPAWLQAAVDQRIALFDDIKVENAGAEIVVTPLTEPPDGDFERWEHSCDNCGVRPPEGVFSGTVMRTTRAGQQVMVMFGCCPDCKNG